MQIKNRQSYAPFGSVSRKRPKKSKNPNSEPGPGSYDVSLPIITPVVQTIRKRNNNIIVKLGHIGTSSFLTVDERFKDEKSSVGPGQYAVGTSEEKKKNNKLERRYAAVKLRALIPHQAERAPTITEIKKVEFDDDIEMPSKEQINKRQLKHNGSRGSVWSRMTQDRLPQSPRSKFSEMLGPGSYDISHDEEIRRYRGSKNSSSFVSGSVRSFFDQLIFQTNHDNKARQRSQKHYKSDLVGPGSYEVSPAKEQKVNKYQFFGSTEGRMV